MAYVIDREHCTNCGRCSMQCPTRAMVGGMEGVSIDKEKCIECGKCASVCPLSALHPESQPWPEIPPHDLKEYNCDLCVIGGGGGGLTAAARFEWQKDRGVKDVLNDTLVKIMDQTYWLLDSHLVRNALKGTGEWFDWLGQLDPDRDSKFVESFYVFDGPDSMITPGYCEPGGRPGSTESNGTGWYNGQLMQKVLKEKDATILTETRATGLEMKDGKVAAVLAKDPGGEVKIHCKACVMSPGSWINNQEILTASN